MPFIKRGRFGVVKGNAVRFFHPYHVDLEVTEPEEISLELVKQKIAEAAGTAIKYHDMDFLEGKQERGFTARSSVVTSPPGINLKSPTEVSSGARSLSGNALNASAPTASGQTIVASDDLDATLKRVRQDQDPLVWLFASYQDESQLKSSKNQAISLSLLASGDALDEDVWRSHLRSDRIVYGLVRLQDRIDEQSVTTKFCYVVFIGEDVGGLTKGRISTHRGQINALFSPYHTDLVVSEAREVTLTAIQQRVKASSAGK